MADTKKSSSLEQQMAEDEIFCMVEDWLGCKVSRNPKIKMNNNVKQLESTIEGIKQESTKIKEELENKINSLSNENNSMKHQIENLNKDKLNLKKQWNKDITELTKENTVRVDKKIDTFLKQHFNQYSAYCSLQDKDLENSTYAKIVNI